MSELHFSITPAVFLREIGWRFKPRGDWLSLKYCPFCDGGSSGDAFTFAVHAEDGNYFCHRAKCGEKGSFWNLIKSQGRNPRDYLSDDVRKPNRKKKKKFIYGKCRQ